MSTPKPVVLSLEAQSIAVPRRPQSQFEVLVRHLLYRFFHNELLGTEEETRRVLIVGWCAALPTVLVALFLFPAYHAFPPAPYPRPFWPQVADHYFFVMYAFCVMGAATVYEWDLLFPDLLDVFVLSVLPIAARRLFLARVLALTIFLALVLIGTSFLGTLAMPAAADNPYPLRHIAAHAIAVAMSGTFSAAVFLSLQGLLLNLLGEGLFRRITPVLQGGLLMLLLAVLLLYPTAMRSLEPLLLSGNHAALWFPPLWFLGIYERLLTGPSALLVFTTLAHRGIVALLVSIALALASYPLAYRRRVRQLVEGARPARSRGSSNRLTNPAIHATLLPTPPQRSIFHFISQTILRSQRQRVMLAMYGGLGVALALANMLVLIIHESRIHPALLPQGIRAAPLILAFWTVAGLSNVLSSPVDLRAAWLFRVLVGRPRDTHLFGARLWITLWAFAISFAAYLGLRPLSPDSLRSPSVTLAQLIVIGGSCLLLPKIYRFTVRTIPFTQLRQSTITDLPLTVLRYVVLFPLLVSVGVGLESWMTVNPVHFVQAILFLAAAQVILRRAHTRYLTQFTVDIPPDETEPFPQGLGLRDS